MTRIAVVLCLVYLASQAAAQGRAFDCARDLPAARQARTAALDQMDAARDADRRAQCAAITGRIMALEHEVDVTKECWLGSDRIDLIVSLQMMAAQLRVLYVDGCK